MSINQISSPFSSARICRPTSARCLAANRFFFVNRPWVVRAAVSRARPSSVFGPLLAPPWTRQRPTGCFAGAWQEVPRRVLAPREYGPGQHGQRRQGKLSDFGIQLRAKQKLKGYYGDLTEKQFRRIYTEAERVKGDTGENLIGLLESRLDAVVYRAKFVATIFAARQFVNHGHVRVNGQKVNIASYRVSEGDVIEVRDRSKQLAVLLEAVQLTERDVPDYMDVDHTKMTATFVRAPGLGDVPYPVVMEPNLVVEFYAKN